METEKTEMTPFGGISGEILWEVCERYRADAERHPRVVDVPAGGQVALLELLCRVMDVHRRTWTALSEAGVGGGMAAAAAACYDEIALLFRVADVLTGRESLGPVKGRCCEGRRAE